MPYSRESGYLQNMVENGITFKDHDRDAVEKLRVSNPQSLIDTDFEYSLQNTKWEFLTLCNNYPGVYARSNEPAFTSEQIASILPSGLGNKSVTVTVTILPRSPFKIGDSIVLKETANTTYVDGAYIITAVFSPLSFQVVTKSPDALVGDQKTRYTALYTGGFYTNAEIPIESVTTIPGTSSAKIQFKNPHNLYIGTPLTVVDYGLSAVPWSGSFEVESVPDDYSVTYKTLTGEDYPTNFISQVTINFPDYPAANGVYTRSSGGTTQFDGPNGYFIYSDDSWVLYSPDEEGTIAQTVIFGFDALTYGPVNPWSDQGFGEATTTNVVSAGTLVVPTTGAVYARTEGVAVHRFFDGGVQINPGTSAPNARIMRQTRKYFKYQSGKSTQFSTGVLFRPVYEITDAFINKNNFLSNGYYIFQLSLSSAPYPAANGVYSRSSGGTTQLNGPNGYYIDYGNFEPDAWALYSPEEGDYLAYVSAYGLNGLSSVTWNNNYAADVTTLSYKDTNPDYPFYDFEISTEQYHGFAQPNEYKEGCLVRITGFETSSNPKDPYNKTFTISKVLNSKTFQVKIPVDGQYNPFPPVPLSPGGLGYAEVLGWNDATVRTGLFDDQNGMFFEFDGKDFWCVKRQTTTPINGTVSVQTKSPWIIGTNTKFNTQLDVNNFINIQGMSYQVGSIVSDLSATVTPAYRGASASGLKVIRTEEQRIHQSEFNLDKLDGTGPSGYKLDLNRMQMMFIDYSWYGAGKIRYGIRAVNGKIIYFHEIYNNNVNIKAHMRSGNLPGRFEISSSSKIGTILQAIPANGNVTISGLINQAGLYNGFYAYDGIENGRPKYIRSSNGQYKIYWDTTSWVLVNLTNNDTAASDSDVAYPWLATDWYQVIPKLDPTGIVLTPDGTAVSKEDADKLPTKGQIVINNEYIKYTKGIDLPKNKVQLLLDERNVGGLTSGPPAHPVNSTFISFNQNCSPALSHWGVAALMDGAFNEDKSYLFTATNSTCLTATSADQALISYRLAPSVDYGIVGNLGERNLVNHTLLKPQLVGLLTNNPVQINVRVNCEPITVFNNLSAWKFVANGSIAQYFDHTVDGTFDVEGTGGDLIASFLISPNAVINSGQFTSQSLNIDIVRELTNSILGGDFPYPDGPDVLTVSVKVLDHLDGNYKAICQGKVSWTEDQG